MTLEEVHRDAETWINRAQIASGEVERLKLQLETEKKSVSEMSTELNALKTELENTKIESERFLLTRKSFDDRKYIHSKAHIKLEDAENTIIELKEELAYKANINRSLALQLEKTIESNSELLLEIKDLDELLQSREKEIEDLREQIENSKFEEEKVIWMSKLDEKEEEIRALKDSIESLQAEINKGSESNTEELEAIISRLKRQLGEAENESAEIRQENMNLLSQLMDLRHQTDKKCDIIRDLESKLAMAHDSSLHAEKALEKKIKDLQGLVNDLREKLRLSEEISQSQQDSNKAFLEDIITKVGDLQNRNEDLEFQLKKSDERNDSLLERISNLENQIIEHEKERSLLASQRGQMKTLREKISIVSEDYQNSLRKIEDLDITNKTLREEHDKDLTAVNQKLQNTEESLNERNAECLNLRKELEEAHANVQQKNEVIRSLVAAKEEVEELLTSLQAPHADLQKQITSLMNENQNLEASLSSLKIEHNTIEEKLRELEERNSVMLNQLQESDEKVWKLTQELESAQGRLVETQNRLAELESEKTVLTQKLEYSEDQRSFHVSENEKLELQISCLKEDIDLSQKSQLESEKKAEELKLQNDGLIEKLEAAQRREAELVTKASDMEQALLEMNVEISELEKKLNELECEREEQNKGKLDLQTSLQVQVDELKASLNETLLEKDKAVSSLNKIKNDNESLLQELSMWKEKKKTQDKSQNVAGTPRIRTQRTLVDDKDKIGKRTPPEFEQKNEVMKAKKHAAELKRKVMEVEEEKEEMRKKFSSLQKELQRKMELLTIAEKKLKEKDREVHVNNQKVVKHPSKTSPRAVSGVSQSSKSLSILSEKVKVLEEKLNVRTVELEATKFLLKEKEEQISSMLMNSNLGNGHSDGTCTEGIEYLGNGSSFHGDTNSDEVRKLQKENQQLRNLLENLNKSIIEGRLSEFQQPSHVDQTDQKTKRESHLEAELSEMRDRYSQMSLQFAELQVEKEELLMTIRNLSRESSAYV